MNLDKEFYANYLDNKNFNEVYKIEYETLFKGLQDYYKNNPNEKGLHGKVFEKTVIDSLYIPLLHPQTFSKDMDLIEIYSPLSATSGDAIDIRLYDSNTNTAIIGSCKCLDILDKKDGKIPFTKTEIHAAIQMARKNNGLKDCNVHIVIGTNQLLTLSSLKTAYEEFIENDEKVDMEIIFSRKELKQKLTDEMIDYASLHQIKFSYMEDKWNVLSNVLYQFNGNVQSIIDNFHNETPLYKLRKSQLEKANELINSKKSITVFEAFCRFGKTVTAFYTAKEWFKINTNGYNGKVITYQTNFPGIYDNIIRDIYGVFKPNEVNIISDNGKNGEYDSSKLNIVLVSSQYTANKNGIKDNILKYYPMTDFYIFDEAHQGIDTKIQKQIKKLLTNCKKQLYISGTPFTEFLGSIEERVVFSLPNILECVNNGTDMSYENYPMPKMIGCDVKKFHYENNYIPNTIEEILSDNNSSYAQQMIKELIILLKDGVDVSKNLDELHKTYKNVWNTTLKKIYAKNILMFFGSKKELLNAEKAINEIKDKLDIKFKYSTSDINSSSKAVSECNKMFDENTNDICIYGVIGQLTTGVTIPNCHAVILMNDSKSGNKILQSCFRANNPHKNSKGQWMSHALWIFLSSESIMHLFAQLQDYAIDFSNPEYLKTIDLLKNSVTMLEGFSLKDLSFDEMNNCINKYVHSKTYITKLWNDEDRFFSSLKEDVEMDFLDNYQIEENSKNNKSLKIELNDKIEGTDGFEKVVNKVENSKFIENSDLETLSQKEKEKELKIKKAKAFLNKIRLAQGHALVSLARIGDVKKLNELISGNFEEKITEFMSEDFEGETRFRYYFNEPYFNEFSNYKELCDCISQYVSLKEWEKVYVIIVQCIIDSINNNETFDISSMILDNDRVKNNGEVFTPIQIVNSMLDLLPKEVWTNKELTFLDNSMGSGIFLMEIKRRLMEGLSEIITDKNEREKHIIENMIYGVELDKKNYILACDSVFGGKNDLKHFVCHDALTFDYSKFGVDKFDIIVGNPPYQQNFGIKGTNSSNSKSIYNLFIEQAITLNPNYIVMITPSRWMTRTSQGISNSWIDKMLECNQFKIIHDFEYSKDCFPSVDIMGGINYFLWKNSYKGKCDYYFHTKGNAYTYHRYEYLNTNNLNIVIRNPKSYEILDKITKNDENYYFNNNFSELVSPKHFFDNSILLTSNWKDYSTTKNDEYNIKYYLNKNTHKLDLDYAWISDNQIPKNIQTKDLHKVYIPTANGSMDLILGKPFYGEPNSVCSQTYLVIGYDKEKHNFNKEQCENIISYMKTKFFRYLVSIKKKTQCAPRGVYQFVPMQDFNEKWTDEKLYKKYDLTQEEINYIESMIRPM